jgi:hypothetical protein
MSNNKVVDIRSWYSSNVGKGYTGNWVMKVRLKLRHVGCTNILSFTCNRATGPQKSSFVENLVNISDEEEDKDCKNTRYEIMAQLIGECVVPIYGKNSIKSRCRQNNSCRFLEKMTMSCLGCCLVLMKDNHEVQETWYLIKERVKSTKEWNLYKQYRKNPKSFLEEDTQMFVIVANSKYTLKKGRQVGYGNYGSSNGLIRYYKVTQNHLEGLNEEEGKGITKA